MEEIECSRRLAGRRASHDEHDSGLRAVVDVHGHLSECWNGDDAIAAIENAVDGKTIGNSNESPCRAGGITVAGPSKGPHRDGDKKQSVVRCASVVSTAVGSDMIVPTDVHTKHGGKGQPPKTSNFYCLPGRAGGPPYGLAGSGG